MLFLLFVSGGLLLLFELVSVLLFLFHREASPATAPPVSVLIPAHNERERLERNIPEVLAAMREGDELIVVDDGSDDGTYELLLQYAAEHPLMLVHNHAKQGKKRAVDIGCQKATHSFILQSDADCRPRSTEWIDRMRGGVKGGASMVLGWGAIEGGKGILDALIRYDTARTAIQYSSFAMLGMPYMGVGRNLLYQKTLRTARKMPDHYYKSMSGDDDLLVAYRSERGKVACSYHPDAHTLSPPPSTWDEHWRRSRRHAEAGFHYPLKLLIPLGILRSAELLFPLLTIFLLFTTHAQEAVIAYGAVMLLRGLFTYFIGKPLISSPIGLLTPFIAFISTMNRTFVELSILVSKPTQWR